MDPPACIDSIGGCSTGPACSYLDLAPADPTLPGYKNDSWPSWGGHPQFWSKDKGGDDKYHLFTAQFADECNVDKWVNNSFVSHSSSNSPQGPWHFENVAIYPWAHGPQIALAPDGTWLLFFTGGWHTKSENWANCSSPFSDHRPPPASGPGLGPTADGCGPAEDGMNPGSTSADSEMWLYLRCGFICDVALLAMRLYLRCGFIFLGCGIRLATAKSPFGPWDVRNVTFSNQHEAPNLNCQVYFTRFPKSVCSHVWLSIGFSPVFKSRAMG